MGSERIENDKERFEFSLVDAADLVYLVYEAHHCRNSGVELHLFDILGYLFNGLVHDRNHFGTVFIAVNDHILKIPDPVEESLAAHHALLAPGSSLLIVTHKEDIGTENICTELIDNVVRVNCISSRLAHLFAVFTEDKTLSGSLCVRLIAGDFADVIEESVPETGVDHVTCNMFHTAVVPVNRHPVFKRFL